MLNTNSLSGLYLEAKEHPASVLLCRRANQSDGVCGNGQNYDSLIKMANDGRPPLRNLICRLDPP